TITGLIALPTSTACTQRSTCTSYVSRSTDTSTRHAAQPNTGYAAPVYVASSQWMPGGGSYWSVTLTSPVAGSFASFSRSWRAARSTSPPTTMQVRLATVGPLSGTCAVDGSITSTSDGS